MNYVAHETFISTGCLSNSDLCILRLSLIRFLLQLLGLHLFSELLLKLLLSQLSQLFGVCVCFRPDNIHCVHDGSERNRGHATEDDAQAMKRSTALRTETRGSAVYLVLMFSLFSSGAGPVLGVRTSEQFCFWSRVLGSSGVLAGTTTDTSISSLTRLENRAFSTDGSPSERLVWAGSRGGGGFVSRRSDKIQHPDNSKKI